MGFNAIYKIPFLAIVPLLLLIGCYLINFKLLRQKLFLDSGLKTKVKEVNTANLKWTKNFGDIAPFLELDLKLSLSFLFLNFFHPSHIWKNLQNLL